MELTDNQVVKPEPPVFLRWTVLVVVSFAMFGNYYIYDCISPLADILVKQLKFSDGDIGLLQGIYSLPNIIMVLIGGYIIDRIGTKKGALLFSAICLIGAFFTVIKGDLVWMATGRLIFGLGAESLIVTVTTIIARWFKGKELSFAFGLNLTIARLGTFAALNSPSWGASFFNSWSQPLWVATGFGIISVLSVIIYFILDRFSENKYKIAKEGNQDKVVFSDILKFDRSFWFISFLCVTFYSAIFPFQTFAVKFFIDKHFVGLPEELARSMGGFLSSLLILATMFLTPVFGLMSDKIGKRASLMMIGSFLIIPVYLFMNYFVQIPAFNPNELVIPTSDSTSGSLFSLLGAQFAYFTKMIIVLFTYYPNLVIPMAIMGIAFSLVPAVMWPSVALVVDQSRLGTAYGLMTLIQNVGLLGLNLLIGAVNDWTGNYTLGMWIFSSLGFFGLGFAAILKRLELRKANGGLEGLS
jgi:MFS family permease